MKTKRTFSNILTLALVVVSMTSIGLAQQSQPQESTAPQMQMGTGFTYQGRLTDGGSPANGEYDLQFYVYDALSGGSWQAFVTQENVTVEEGLFTVMLNFGPGVFTGQARYLEIRVRPGSSSGDYTTLFPRQTLTPAPYALALPGLWTKQNATSPNLIGGYHGNSVTSGVVGATVGGGGAADDGSGNSIPNGVTDDYGTVGGGGKNQAGNDGGTTSDASYATVGGGWENNASHWFATVGGGGSNAASGNGSTIGGGAHNEASDVDATVGGGYYNVASGFIATVSGGSHNTAIGQYATTSGGELNTASGNHATVAGGGSNVAATYYATVGGGQNNVASGDYSVVPGGLDNNAGNFFTFAAGRNAKAHNIGCFVWGDGSTGNVECNDDHRWVARASGGVYFYTNSGLTSGVYVAAGGNSWNSISDQATKENFTPVDGQAILEQLADVPIQEYKLKSQEESIRHVGPVAQDFYAAFGYGESDLAINMEDADGVALVAIQGLYELSREQAVRLKALKAENAAQQAQIDALVARIDALEAADAQTTTAMRPFQIELLSGISLIGLGLVWLARRRETR